MVSTYLHNNGKLVRAEKSFISVDNKAFRYGLGCFETIKVINGVPQLFNAHCNRLFGTMVALQFSIPSYFTQEYLLQSIQAVIQKNSHIKLARIRITVYGGDGGLYDASASHPNCIIQSWALNTANNELNENGLVVGLYEAARKSIDDFAAMKTNNFLPYLLAATYAKQAKYNDALLLNNNHNIADATIANVFIQKGETLYTPALTEGPIAGIMRNYIIDKCKNCGIEVVQTVITKKDCIEADAMFLSNSIYGIKWVKQYTHATYPMGMAAAVFNNIIKPLNETTFFKP